jgi:acetyl-CoA acetyltransferase
VSETTGRPLPLVTIENESFWTSGSDGRLRFQECENFTINCLSWIEALGFWGIGEAKDFLDGGRNIARDGVLLLNTHGGQLSHGRTHGMGLLHEAVSQLRGEAGPRQVADAKVGVVSSGGLTPSGVILLRTDT